MAPRQGFVDDPAAAPVFSASESEVDDRRRSGSRTGPDPDFGGRRPTPRGLAVADDLATTGFPFLRLEDVLGR